MLRYSEDGLAARPAFFASNNDIIIIVEDEGKENFYNELMKGLFQGHSITTKILGVGGKRQVLTRLDASSKSPNWWQEFYVVDGDFDDLLGNASPRSSHFYRLHRYDIESYLLEEAAICAIAEEESPNYTVAEYKNKLTCDTWIANAIDATVRLAACAALLQELSETHAGISQSIERYISKDSALPDIATIDSHIGKVRASQTVVTPQRFDELLEQMIKRMGHLTTDRIRWISGKHILIPLLIRLLRLKISRGLKKESLCFRLARHCEFSGLTELRDCILAAV